MLDLVTLSLFDASAFFQWFVDNASYMFVFLFMLIESSFIPFPSEVVVPPAAYLACVNTGAGADMNIYMVVVMATLGALCGAFVNYYLALWVGRPVVYRFADSRGSLAPPLRCFIQQLRGARLASHCTYRLRGGW